MTFLFHLLRDLWFLVAFLSAPENFRIILNLFVKILTILNSELGGKQRRITVDGAPPTTEAPSLPIEAEPRDDCDSAAIARWISSNSWALSEATWAWMLCFCRFKKEKSLQRTLQASFIWNNSYHFYERAISCCEFHISGEKWAEIKLSIFEVFFYPRNLWNRANKLSNGKQRSISFGHFVWHAQVEVIWKTWDPFSRGNRESKM